MIEVELHIQPFARAEAVDQHCRLDGIVQWHHGENPVNGQFQPEEDEGCQKSPNDDAAESGDKREAGIACAPESAAQCEFVAQ